MPTNTPLARRALAAVYARVSRLPVLGFRAEREYEHLRALHRETRALLSDPDAQPFEVRPDVSGWSPAQHVEHTAQINQSVLRWLHEQCDGGATPGDADRAGRPPGTPNAIGCVLLLAGRMPRGRARTPSEFEPPERPKREVVEAAVEESEALLDGLKACLPGLSRLTGRRKHPRMGRLDPREWLRFARMHTRHHQHIVREIVEK
jgi:hypothetical protein